MIVSHSAVSMSLIKAEPRSNDHATTTVNGLQPAVSGRSQPACRSPCQRTSRPHWNRSFRRNRTLRHRMQRALTREVGRDFRSRRRRAVRMSPVHRNERPELAGRGRSFRTPTHSPCCRAELLRTTRSGRSAAGNVSVSFLDTAVIGHFASSTRFGRDENLFVSVTR